MHETTPTLSVTAQVEQAPSCASFAEKLGAIKRDGAAATSRVLQPPKQKQASTSVEKGPSLFLILFTAFNSNYY